MITSSFRNLPFLIKVLRAENMTRKKIIILTFILASILLASYFIFFSSPHYKITTPVRKNLFVVKSEKNTLLSRAKNFFQKQQQSGRDSGICAPPGCGNPYGTENREDISLLLSDEQITSLLNQYKQTSVLLTNMKVEFSDQAIFASATSLYPFIPGQLSVSARLYINHFYINDAYVGNIKAPGKIANFIEANGDKIIKDILAKYGVWLGRMELVDGKLSFKANVPKGMITVNQNGTILVNLQEIQESQNNVEQNPDVRF